MEGGGGAFFLFFTAVYTVCRSSILIVTCCFLPISLILPLCTATTDQKRSNRAVIGVLTSGTDSRCFNKGVLLTDWKLQPFSWSRGCFFFSIKTRQQEKEKVDFECCSLVAFLYEFENSVDASEGRHQVEISSSVTLLVTYYT